MRPVVITANLLLVVLMSMSTSAWTPDYMCRTNYPATPCPYNYDGGWFQFGPKRCVKAFHFPKLTFDQAEKKCRQYRNGHLVSIHSLVELCQVECAMYRVNKGKTHYWIGHRRDLFDYGRKIRIYWTDGTPYNFGYWARHQPDINFWRDEECTEMNYGEWGYWNNQYCGDYRSFVCAVTIK